MCIRDRCGGCCPLTTTSAGKVTSVAPSLAWHWLWHSAGKAHLIPPTLLKKRIQKLLSPNGGWRPIRTTPPPWPSATERTPKKRTNHRRSHLPPMYRGLPPLQPPDLSSGPMLAQPLSITGMTSISTSSPGSSGSLGRMIPARLGALNSRLTSSAERLFNMSTRNLLLKPISMSSPW